MQKRAMSKGPGGGRGKGRGAGKGKMMGKRKPRSFVLRKKKCKFCTDKTMQINHLDYQLLRRLTTERGKITPSRVTGTCAKHQRKVTKAIKRARNIGILPYLAE